MGRAPCCDKANVKKGPWSPEEDAKLKGYIEKNGTGGNWIALPQKIGLKRCGKSCRLRWLNYLRPNIKHGGFSEEEDNIICSLYISIGSRWSIIAAQLPGRTDNDIKNYWNTRLKKKLLGRRKQPHANRLSSNKENDANNGVAIEEQPQEEEALSHSALERLQLHLQLQTLQNPFSFYNNPALWPKLHPLQQKMVQSLQSSNQNPNPSASPQEGVSKTDFYGPSSFASSYSLNPHQQELFSALNNNPKTMTGFNNSISSMSSSDSKVLLNKADEISQENNNHPVAELDDLLNSNNNNNKAVPFLPEEENHDIPEFDCFGEIEVSKNNNLTTWWSNDDVDTNFPYSSNSWDSNFALFHQRGDIFQDHALGYNLQ